MRRSPAVVRRRLGRTLSGRRWFGAVDRPVAGATVVLDAVEVRGWSVDRQGRVPAAIAVSIDGRVVGWTVGGTGNRHDVALAYDDLRWANTGWSLIVPLGGRTGWVELDVHLWPTLSAQPRRWPPVRVYVAPATAPTGVTGWLDCPTPDVEVARAAVVVAGWALDPAGPVRRVEVRARADGREVARSTARLGLARPDLAATHPHPHAVIAGFEDLLDLTAVPAAVREVELEVLAGGCVIARSAVRLAPRAEPGVAPVPAGPPRAGTAEPLRLLVFTHHLGYGGGQLWLSTLLAAMGAGREFACTVLAPADGPLRPQLEALGITVRLALAPPLDDAFGYRSRIEELQLLAESLGVNAVLANTTGSFPGADVARASGLPVVWAIHESFTPAQFVAAANPPGAVCTDVEAALLAALHDSHAVVFEAAATRELYRSALRPERALVVPYGVDTAAISTYCATTSVAQARAQLGLDADRRVVLVMGTTEPRKAQTVIAAAVAELTGGAAGTAPAGVDDVVVAIVGHGPGRYGEALAAYVQRSGGDGRVLLVPVVGDVRPWYRAADLLLSASDVESLPRSVLEAMCFGVPVLAAAVYGLPELLEDGRTGFLVEPRDLTALVAALRRVLSLDSGELAAVGAAGRAVALAQHDAAGYATTIRALLEGLRADPGADPAALAGSAVGP